MATRVALLTNIPSPYRIPFFRELSRRCELSVFFDALSEPNRNWSVEPSQFGFRHKFLKGICISFKRHRSDLAFDDERYFQLRYEILPALLKFKPDVVISAELGSRTLQAYLYCLITRRPLIVWWEGTAHSEGWQKGIRRHLRKWLVRRVDRFWSNGKESTALLVDYGVPVEKIDDAMTGIDTREWKLNVRKYFQGRDALRQRFGLSGVVFCLPVNFQIEKESNPIWTR